MIYVGLDVAETMGVALWHPKEERAEVFEVKGLPYEQMEVLRKLEYDKRTHVFAIERLTHMRNANVVRSLHQRAGYLKFSLLKEGCMVNEVNINSVRHLLETKNKRETHDVFLDFYQGDFFTNNHSDALAAAIYQANKDGFTFEWRLKITQWKGCEHENR